MSMSGSAGVSLILTRHASARLTFVLAEGYSSVTDVLVRLAGVDPATLGLEGDSVLVRSHLAGSISRKSESQISEQLAF